MQPAPSRRRTLVRGGAAATALALLVLVAQAAFSAPRAPAPPTITSAPAASTSSPAATFTFTGPSGAGFQCALDSASYASCTSPRAYSALADGTHTFRVRSVVGAQTSAAASYAWTVDRVAPPAPTLTTKPAALSTSTTPSLGFTDAEPGVTFLCALDGAALLPCTSPRAYAGLGQGAHTFRVRAVDAAGNAGAVTSYGWTIDSVAPAAPVLTSKPTDPTYDPRTVFDWTASESGLTFQCAFENGAWSACTRPFTWDIGTTNYGQHQFAVRAKDAAGNVSAAAAYSFKYAQSLASGRSFTITGSVRGLTLGVWTPIAVRLSNPENVPIKVMSLTVAVSADSVPTGCPSAANVELQQSDVSSSRMVTVPAQGSVVLPSGGVSAPRIRLVNRPTVNQDSCKGVSFRLTYSGTARR